MNYGLLTMLTEGRAADMEVWRGRDVNDFFHALWSHEDYLKDRAKAMNPKKHQPDGEPGRDHI